MSNGLSSSIAGLGLGSGKSSTRIAPLQMPLNWRGQRARGRARPAPRSRRAEGARPLTTLLAPGLDQSRAAVHLLKEANEGGRAWSRGSPARRATRRCAKCTAERSRGPRRDPQELSLQQFLRSLGVSVAHRARREKMDHHPEIFNVYNRSKSSCRPTTRAVSVKGRAPPRASIDELAPERDRKPPTP